MESNVTDIPLLDVPKFHWADYLVFSLLLLASAAIGVYHACTGGHQSTTKEFLLADKKMKIVPVTMSMLASFLSAITLMGNPAEIYNYGTQFLMIGLSYLLVMPAAAHLYIPVFYKLNITSAYEYLEMRFSKGVRLAASCTFMLQMVFYMAIVLYAPALALNQVTGLNVWISVISVGVVCTFYTALGGMKAVMYTDLLQMVIMICGMLVILIKGSLDVGGIGEVFRIAGEGERLELFNFDPDPRTRHTFWTLFFGATFTWLALYGVNQATVQRALSVSSLKTAQMAIYLNIPGLICSLVITTGCGLIIYAKYAKCDPVTLKQVKSADQLVPLFVMESLGQYPGLPGLFVSAIFSGSLSTLSSGFNSLAAITLQDIVKSYRTKPLTEKQATLIAKILAAGFGLLCIALSFIASKMGGILQAAMALFGIIGGPLLGLFSLAIFFPWANWKGAYAALISSLILTSWIAFGAMMVYPPNNPKKPFSIKECLVSPLTNQSMDFSLPYSVYENISSLEVTTKEIKASNHTDRPAIANLYAVSYLYYSFIAVATSLVVGMIVSLASGRQDPKQLDPRLVSPILAKLLCCLPEDKKKSLWCGVPHDREEEFAKAIESRATSGIDSSDELQEFSSHAMDSKNVPLDPFEQDALFADHVNEI